MIFTYFSMKGIETRLAEKDPKLILTITNQQSQLWSRNFLIDILSDIFQQNVSLLRNIILYEYSGVSFESYIALNHFLARLDESMNNHIISARATCKILTIFKTEMTTETFKTFLTFFTCIITFTSLAEKGFPNPFRHQALSKLGTY